MTTPMKDYYVASRHCAICGEALIQQRTPFTPSSQSEEWLYSFRAALINDYKHGVELTDSAFFTSVTASSNVDVNVPGSPDRLVTISPQRSCSDVAHCFHSCCWRFLKLRRPRLLPAHIYNLAATLNSRYDREVYVNPFIDGHTVYRALAWLESSPTTSNPSSESINEERNPLDLSRLLTCISRKLPPELISMVWACLPICPVRSLLSVAAGGSIDILDRLAPCESESSGSIRCDKHITAYVTVIGGEEYICGLDDGAKLCGHRSEKHDEVSISSTVSGVRFSRGRYGIRRLWLHCQDGSVKSLGGMPSRLSACIWAGFFSQTAPFVRLWWDGLKLCDIDRLEEGPAPFGERLLWDSDSSVSLTHVLPVETYYQHPRQDDMRPLPWIPIRHLPLSDNSQGRLRGITAFCNANGITGIGSHFEHSLDGDRTIWIGRQIGCPLHFRLKDTEVITSIWTSLLNIDTFFFTTFITIKTSNNRTCRFGPAVHPSAITTKLLADDHHGKISGLYFHLDPSETNMVKPSATSFGVYYSREKRIEKKPSPAPDPQMPAFPPGPIHCAPFRLYVSEATMSDVRELRVCSTDARCTGMIITHSDGSQDVLGRWYEDSPSAVHAVLHGRHPGNKHGAKLYMKLSSTSKGATLLREVALRPFSERRSDTDTDDDEFIFKNVEFGDTITWWFSENLDVITSSRHQT